MASSLALMQAMHWQHPELPASIRLPWKVFQENLEDLRDDEESQSHPEADTMRNQLEAGQLEAISVRGALPVFLELDISEQEAYAEVSMMELSAYHHYRQKTEAAWNDFDCDEKAKWVPENHRAGLAHSRWAPLLAGGPPPCSPTEAPAKRRRIRGKTPAAGEEPAKLGPRGGRVWSWLSWGKETVPCPLCDRRIARSNMSKHQRSPQCAMGRRAARRRSR